VHIGKCEPAQNRPFPGLLRGISLKGVKRGIPNDLKLLKRKKLNNPSTI